MKAPTSPMLQTHKRNHPTHCILPELQLWKIQRELNLPFHHLQRSAQCQGNTGQAVVHISINLLFLCHLSPEILTHVGPSRLQCPQADTWITKGNSFLLLPLSFGSKGHSATVALKKTQETKSNHYSLVDGLAQSFWQVLLEAAVIIWI